MKGKFVLVLLAVLIVVCGCRNYVIVPIPPVHEAVTDIDSVGKKLGFSGGNGTESHPYEVNGASQLITLQQLVQDGRDFAGEYIILDGSDIVLGGENTSNWAGIGSADTPFRGIFDGNGSTVSGLNISVTPESNGGYGFFSFIGDGAEISNLTVSGNLSSTGEAPDADDTGFGLLVGIATGNVTIENCHTAEGSTVKGETAAGIIGMALGNVTITGSSNSASVSSMGNIGDKVAGIIASMTNTVASVSITETDNHGDISAVRYSGGIAGLIYNAVIDDCNNTGAITGGSNIGGIIGNPRGDSRISNVTNSGKITIIENQGAASGAVGGIAGYPQSGTAEIVNAVNSGEISLASSFNGTTVTNIGGIVGNTAASIVEIYGSENTGEIKLVSENVKVTSVGGIAGSLSAGATIDADEAGNITSNSAAIVAGDQTGGIVGSLSGNGAVKAENSGAVSGGARIGGIVGYAASSSGSIIISDSKNKGNITGASDYAGGVVGYAYTSTGEGSIAIENSESSSDVTISSETSYAGGIAGRTVGNVMITESDNYSAILASTYAGGITGNSGNSEGYESTEDFIIGITYCNNHGDVTSTADNGYACGIGYNGTGVIFDNCVNEGAITGFYVYGIGYRTDGVTDCQNTGTVTSTKP